MKTMTVDPALTHGHVSYSQYTYALSRVKRTFITRFFQRFFLTKSPAIFFVTFYIAGFITNSANAAVFADVGNTTTANKTESAPSEEFPGRQLYPDFDYIDIAAFHEKLSHDQVLLIDVRSHFEFETLHIKKATNIPIASRLFIKNIKQLREKDKRPIVTYCNGKTCMKSYKAAKKLRANHFDNVLVFDAGVMDYARAYPNEAILLGKIMKSPKHLISQSEFAKHALIPEKFTQHIASSNAILLDIRDRVQRTDGISLFAGREHRVTLDSTRRLDRYIEKAKKNNQGLLIYDASGKQVRWLQYRLKQSGIKDYLFMAGGATAYYQYLESQ